jgi:small nuclear ribonucleoprotein (snRNP)-like protein
LVLYKKFRQLEKDERGYTIEDIDKAYKSLKGIFYLDPEEERKKKQRRENPNPIFKLLKIDEEKALNSIYYYKWHALGILAVIVFAVMTIISVVKKVDPNLRILIAGKIYMSETTAFEEKITNELETVEKAQVQNIYLSGEARSEADVAMQTKFTVEIAVGNNDIFIIDEEKYFMLATQGAFKPVKDFIGDLRALGIDEELNKDLIVTMELNDGITYEPELYGIDVSDNAYLLDAGIISERMIMAFGSAGEFPQNAAAFAELILK